MITRGGFDLRGLDLRMLKMIGARPGVRTADVYGLFRLHDRDACDRSLDRLATAGLIRYRPAGSGFWSPTDLGLEALRQVWNARRRKPRAALRRRREAAA